MRNKGEEFDVRDYKSGNGYMSKGIYKSLGAAAAACKYNAVNGQQATWDEVEALPKDSEYSVIFCYRDDEHFDDIYFIPKAN